MEIPGGAFVVAHKVHVLSKVVERLLSLSTEDSNHVIIIAATLSIGIQVITIITIECRIVLNLVECFLNVTLLEHLPEGLSCFQFLHSFSCLLLLLVFAFQLVVPMFLLEDIEVECFSHIGEFTFNFLLDCHLLASRSIV